MKELIVWATWVRFCAIWSGVVVGGITWGGCTGGNWLAGCKNCWISELINGN